jgi:hypothetical protein
MIITNQKTIKLSPAKKKEANQTIKSGPPENKTVNKKKENVHRCRPRWR